MNPTIVQFYPDASKSLIALTEALLVSVAARTRKPFYLALSGGETARRLFELWRTRYHEPARWKNVHFFWVDERCVPPDSEESNFYWAERLFFKPVGISPDRIYRIRGEEPPGHEAERYARLIAERLPDCNGVPRFDCTLLGIGEDEHVASIFGNDPGLLQSDDLYAVSQHPATGQYRVTQTGEVILASREILIALVGERKKELLHRLVSRQEPAATPAAYILSHTTRATIFTEIELHSRDLSL
ncbi:6-phosphogluconolactonase [Barnesiella sp. An55]|uniref:6-phosphogluconolactonase n=1 Tax=Barnesiella sp. An55 TaxID=1965646 RepID=UPI000B37F4A1|nr:6-phosphogluconolactonase [Barnesiella sp. An55]OUN73458.1 6-phosphogluconolactonase [Barnesiella sp. An55]